MLDKLVGDPKLSSEDVAQLFGAGDFEAQRDSEDYIRTHWDALMKRLPTSANEDFPLAMRLMGPFTASCDAERRDDVVTFLQTHFASIPSGDRPTKQAIESYDRCLARKKRVEPGVRAWLAK
jgi:hypothetical protein